MVRNDVIVNKSATIERCIARIHYVISEKGLDIPQTSREAFQILANHQVIDEQLSRNMQGMVGFRNVAVHDYTKLDLQIVKRIIEERLTDLTEFAATVIRLEFN